MPYGTIKVDTITFTAGGVDTSVSISGLVQNPTFTGNITSTGTISGNIIRGGTTVSGATVTGTAGQFGTLTGNTAGFTTVTGTTVTGTTATFVTVSGTTVTGTTAQFTAITGGTAGFTTVTGTTVTGTTANFVTVSGTTVTGSFGNFTSITGATVAITSGVFASGTAAAPSITFTGDVDTGVFASAANQVSFTTSGTERLRIDETGQIEAVSLGTEAAPVFSFTTDPNTGIYSPGADQLAISTGGSGRLFINSNGDIGLGTNSPDVFGRFYTRTIGLSSSGSTAIQINSATGSSAIIDLGVNAARTAGITSNINETTIATLTATPLVFQTNGGERLRITSAGLVGVGNSSPGSYNASSDDLVVGDHVGAHGVTICSQNNSSGYIMFADGTTGAQTYAGQITYDHTNNRLTLGTNDGTTGLTIDSSQRVGIGTSSPAQTLDVNGTVNFKPAAGYNVLFQQSSTSLRLNYLNDAGSANVSAAYRATSYEWQKGDGAPVVNIDSSGRVGIGVTSVSANLQVAGASDGADVIRAQANGTNGLMILRPDGANGNQLRFGGDGANANVLRFVSGGDTERARIDSSGRLLVGTSSASDSGALLKVQGNTGGSTGAGWLEIRRGTTTPASGGQLALLSFADASGNQYADIQAFVDATPGTNDYPGRLVFSTTVDGASSPTERMRIGNDGRVFVGCQSSPSASVFGTMLSSNLLTEGHKSSVDTTSSNVHYVFFNPNGAVGSISTNGSATAYNTSSDYRLKENVAPISDGIARLQQLKPSRFNFIIEPDHIVDGFIAHEAQEVVPEAITGEKDAVDEDGNPIYQGIDQSKLVPLLTAALQEAIGEIESLKARLTAAGI